MRGRLRSPRAGRWVVGPVTFVERTRRDSRRLLFSPFMCLGVDLLPGDLVGHGSDERCSGLLHDLVPGKPERLGSSLSAALPAVTRSLRTVVRRPPPWVYPWPTPFTVHGGARRRRDRARSATVGWPLDLRRRRAPRAESKNPGRCWPSGALSWLRGLDLNQRSLGYEPFPNQGWSQGATNNASQIRASHVVGFGALWLSLGATSWVIPG